jgi:hypothetical protein
MDAQVRLICCDVCLNVRVMLKDEPHVGVTADSAEEKLKGNTRPLYPCKQCQRPMTFHEVYVGFLNILMVRPIVTPKPTPDIQP